MIVNISLALNARTKAEDSQFLLEDTNPGVIGYLITKIGDKYNVAAIKNSIATTRDLKDFYKKSADYKNITEYNNWDEALADLPQEAKTEIVMLLSKDT